MKTGSAGIKLIKEFESLHDGDLSQIGLQPKMDPIGIWTEGYGHAMRDSKGEFLRGKGKKDLAYKLSTISNKQDAEEILKKDLVCFEQHVSRKIKIKLTQNQYDALVSHAFNTGGSDTLYKLINQRAPEAQIRKWFETKYVTAGGKKLNGLVRRRKAESDLFFT